MTRPRTTGPEPADFDRLARVYRALEFCAFGRALERARFCLLDGLRDRRSILVLGEGDGRCLARLLEAAPEARIDCVDASRGMLERAAARIAARPGRERALLVRADALSAPFPGGSYDAAVTLFFLDCFTPEEAAGLVGRIGAALPAGGLWLWADFAVPPRGPARLWGRAVVGGLYAFFRRRTGISARELPPAEALIAAAGFVRRETRTFRRGLLRTTLFAKAGPGA